MLTFKQTVMSITFSDTFREKYVVHEVPMDGNCVFSALAAGLGSPHTAQSVRSDVVQHASTRMEEVII
jgi:hypothetical protein